MILAKHYIKDKNKARNEFRTWFGQVNINIEQTLSQGFIEQYHTSEERAKIFCDKIGGGKYEIIKVIK